MWLRIYVRILAMVTCFYNLCICLGLLCYVLSSLNIGRPTPFVQKLRDSDILEYSLKHIEKYVMYLYWRRHQSCDWIADYLARRQIGYTWASRRCMVNRHTITHSIIELIWILLSPIKGMHELLPQYNVGIELVKFVVVLLTLMWRLYRGILLN